MGGATDVVHRRCGDRPCEEMDDRVVEELRAFISQRYSSFMTSTLTFRHLKQHLSDTLGLPYGMFSLPDGRYADTLAVDRAAGQSRRALAARHLDVHFDGMAAQNVWS